MACFICADSCALGNSIGHNCKNIENYWRKTSDKMHRNSFITSINNKTYDISFWMVHRVMAMTSANQKKVQYKAKKSVANALNHNKFADIRQCVFVLHIHKKNKSKNWKNNMIHLLLWLFCSFFLLLFRLIILFTLNWNSTELYYSIDVRKSGRAMFFCLSQKQCF